MKAAIENTNTGKNLRITYMDNGVEKLVKLVFLSTTMQFADEPDELVPVLQCNITDEAFNDIVDIINRVGSQCL